MNWFVFKLSDAALAVATFERLNLKFSYPIRRTRVPRKPDVVEPLLRNYSLVTFDPDYDIPLEFESGTRYVPWPVLINLPGVARIFHDGVDPLPIRGPIPPELLGLTENVVSYVSRFLPGDRAPILSGPFAGLLALVTEAGEGSVTAQVSIFGRSCAAEFLEENLGDTLPA